MKIVTIIENNPITGVHYGVVEISQYNDVTQRRIQRYNNFRNKLRLKRVANTRANRTKHK